MPKLCWLNVVSSEPATQDNASAPMEAEASQAVGNALPKGLWARSGYNPVRLQRTRFCCVCPASSCPRGAERGRGQYPMAPYHASSRTDTDMGTYRSYGNIQLPLVSWMGLLATART